ncbi:hypothetical protein [Sinisalibacter lacisalsi]|uniref:Translation initiation factor 3 n=1 Tax=Sinisalibacter lacisalsi TaxID=1526570 RepID=A0ABQ1QQW7_9RHOB|nr:hypothetical protein [Sinisalibacter lacisalsi]GGD41427.1 hypothetical protein GCM10011358_26640 [Sinisalibacter lacisalsi]
MNKTWITLILLIAVAIGGYAWWATQDGNLTEDETPVMTPEATEPADEPEAEPEADEDASMLDDATGAAQDAADAMADTASDATDAMNDAASDAVDSAMDTAGEAASDAMDSMSDAVDDTADTTGETAAEAAETGTESAMSITDLLTVENFDAEKITMMIDQSDLGEAQKATLKSAVESAGDSPEEIEAVIDQIKQAMGI